MSTTRIPEELAQVLEEIGKELSEHPDVQSYRQTVADAESSSEAAELEGQLMQLTRSLQSKQQSGDIGQEEIAEYRQLQSKYRSRPEIAARLEAEAQLKEISQSACDAVSEQLGVDFAGIAAPQSC